MQTLGGIIVAEGNAVSSCRPRTFRHEERRALTPALKTIELDLPVWGIRPLCRNDSHRLLWATISRRQYGDLRAAHPYRYALPLTPPIPMSAGIEMLEGAPPYTGQEPLRVRFCFFSHLVNGTPEPRAPETLSTQPKDFLAACLEVAVEERTTAAKLVEHEFLKKVCDAVDLAPFAATELLPSVVTDQQQTNPAPTALAQPQPYHTSRSPSISLAAGDYGTILAVPGHASADNAESGHGEEGKGEREARGARLRLIDHDRSLPLLFLLPPPPSSRPSTPAVRNYGRVTLDRAATAAANTVIERECKGARRGYCSTSRSRRVTAAPRRSPTAYPQFDIHAIPPTFRDVNPHGHYRSRASMGSPLPVLSPWPRQTSRASDASA
ncbi:hypothetical protein DFH06DRAFT_1340287 [Mycena polygramma]|nr:hypothetical protein DFH06DRAFT_1340287 [Mycena polygramma]